MSNLADRDDLTAISLRNFDASTFNESATKFQEGDHAGLSPTGYVRNMVLLAAVCSWWSIGSTVKLRGVRYAPAAIGSALLIFSIVLISQQPGLPS